MHILIAMCFGTLTTLGLLSKDFLEDTGGHIWNCSVGLFVVGEAASLIPELFM
jgi:hypothetical protein